MYHLFIATPEKVIYEGDVKDLIVPGSMGSFEILSDHAPIISTLKAGDLVVTDNSGTLITWTISSGYLECLKNKVTILADVSCHLA